jgi:hypothetical protein
MRIYLTNFCLADDPRLFCQDRFNPDGTEVYHDPVMPVLESPDSHVKIELRKTMTSVMRPNADMTAIVRYDRSYAAEGAEARGA